MRLTSEVQALAIAAMCAAAIPPRFVAAVSTVSVEGLLEEQASLVRSQEARPGVDWPQFRGIAAGGVAEGFGLPVRWNAETGENVRWKTAIPGLAHSSPVVWRDMVCATTAVAENKEEALKVGLYGDMPIWQTVAT